LLPFLGKRGISAIALNPSNDCADAIVSCDDKTLIHINTETFKSLSDPISVGCYVTSLSWQPSIGNQYSKGQALLATACSDGSLILFKPNRVGQKYSMVGKKKIAAHEGSVACVQWSPDGSSLVSSGEDGHVKIWSQTGHLRSTLARFDRTVNCVAWNTESCSVVSAHGAVLNILPVQNRGDLIEWQVSDDAVKNGVILDVDWSNKSGLIICGGEDCKFRVFDSLGVALFVSETMNHPATSVAWLPTGEAFVVGSFDTIYFCGKGGEYIKCYNTNTQSSIVDMKWTKDSSQLFASCSTGAILALNVVGKVCEWNGVLVELFDANQLRLNLIKEGECEFIQIQQ
jgi:intraflagellar transport protein 80